MEKIKLVLMAKGKKYFIRDTSKDYHTEFGFISAKDLESAKPGSMLESNTGVMFSVINPSFFDQYSKIKRGAQIIARKDIGIIIAETGLGPESVVLDAGSGSGALITFLAHIVKKAYTYEIREDFFKIVKKNIEYLGLKNIVQKNKDIYEGIDEKDIDCIILDLPEPWQVIPHAEKALKPGGFLISYSPCIPQTADFVNALPAGMMHMKTVEISEREWEIKGRKLRPKTRQLGHTGFLSFVRKIQ